MTNSNRLLQFIAAALAVLLIGGLLCTCGLGLGFVAGRYAANNAQVAAAGISDDEPAPPPAAPEPTPEANATLPPPTDDQPPAEIESENFGVFWEAMNLLEEHFEGDVPSDETITQAAIDGIEDFARGCKDDDETTPAPIVIAPQAPRQAPDNFDDFWTFVNETYAACGMAAPPVTDLPFVAFQGVAERLDDDYTDLLPPARAEQFRIDLDSSFEGIGSTVNEAEQGGVLIVRPFPGSPAETAGLLSGDIIIAVDGEDITGLTLDEAIQLIRGPAGTDVLLSIRRQGQDEPFAITVTRDRIDIPVLEAETTAQGLLHVSLFDFSPRGGDELRQTLEQAMKDGVKGVILDLRRNPGGRLDVAIDVAGMFIADGVIVREKGTRNIEHTAPGNPILPAALPLAVLVDGGSASASEIVAGAIQDYARGPLIGETTFGKGSVQSLFDLSDGSLLRVTTSHWFTPNDRQIENQGLTPDLAIPFDADAETDNQLQAAIDYLLEKMQEE
jgi:carboxyl-terminal processing protease